MTTSSGVVAVERTELPPQSDSMAESSMKLQLGRGYTCESEQSLRTTGSSGAISIPGRTTKRQINTVCKKLQGYVGSKVVL